MPARRQSLVGDEDSTPRDRNRGKDGKEKETFGCAYPGCGQTYSRMEYLKRHQRKHQDDRPFQCKDCAKAFARSDVLLRHRRRCHPTPPPTDQNNNSPPAPHRSYPGMPVSSSRTDAREMSPTRGRKHPRQSSTGSHEAAQRRRMEEEEDDDDEPFAESSRFGRQNGMGNGGVYGMSNGLYGDHAESSYTPHLLPVFQQTTTHYQHPNEDHHLEDASVLLSMAYPGGVPGNDNGMTVGGQRVVPDWEANQSINMMLESTDQDNGSNRTGSVSSTVAEGIGGGNQTVLPEMGNFLGTLNWLSGTSSGASQGKEVNGNTGEGSLNQWTLATANSPKPLSPYPLSSLFSPSAFGLNVYNGNHANGVNGDDEEAANNAAVMTILDQLAMYDTPQSRTNMNPERPLIRVEKAHARTRQGLEIADKDSPFFLDADRFSGCYQIPHWRMPPIKTLSLIACRTFHTVLNHFSFVHMPTFRLVDTAACLAFAICTVGGIRGGGQDSWGFKLDTYKNQVGPICQIDELDGPVPPGSTWESTYRQNYRKEKDDYAEDAKQVEKWESSVIVRNEKSNMLVKSFALAKGVLMTEYNVALLQALVLYHAPYFLSQNEQERQIANMFLGTIVNITRQIGFFTQELEHFEPELKLPEEPYTPNDLNLYWRRWIQLETRRRTAFLVYHLDIVSALESNIPCILTPCELANLPLPAPDTLWKATTAEEWYSLAKNYQSMTLDEAMRRIFFIPTYGSFHLLHERADTKCLNMHSKIPLGPFARSAMVTTILRGIMDIGTGKRDRGDWRDLTDLWISSNWLKPGRVMLSQDGKDLGPVSREKLYQRFTFGLERWREGWDFDPLCPVATGCLTQQTSSSPESSSSSVPGDNQKLNYCEEALPFYWLAQALLNILKSSAPYQAGHSHFYNVKYGEMLKSARTFSRLGEGVPIAEDVAVARVGSGSGSGSGSNGSTGPTNPEMITPIDATMPLLGEITQADLEGIDFNMLAGFDLSAASSGNGGGYAGLDLGDFTASFS